MTATSFSQYGFNPDYYECLEVPKNASSGFIRKSYLELALKYHPDKSATSDAAIKNGNEARFKVCQHAYGIIGQDKSRECYDQWLRNQYVYEFLNGNDFNGTTTSTTLEIAGFLEQNGFPAYMRRLGLPIEGVALSLDEVVWFHVGPAPRFEELFAEIIEAESESDFSDGAYTPSIESQPHFKDITNDWAHIRRSLSNFSKCKWQSRYLCLLAFIFVAGTVAVWYLKPPTHYEILTIPVTATNAEIKQAYRQAIRTNHPDKAGGSGEAAKKAQEITIRISEAYEMLSTDKRCRYDYYTMRTGRQKYRGCQAKHRRLELERREQERRASEVFTDESEHDRAVEEDDAGERPVKEEPPRVHKYVQSVVAWSASATAEVRWNVAERLTKLINGYHWICHQDEIMRVFAFIAGMFFGFDPCV